MTINETIIIPAHCVMVPFLNRHEQVARCLDALLEQTKPNTVFLLIDDGSTPQAIHSQPLQPILCKPNVYLIHHRDNYGVSAARNSGLHWCRQNNFDIVMMIDSDCIPEEGLIDQHLQLHKQHPEADCIGGHIMGRGKSFWAKLDGLVSWTYATPQGPVGGKSEFRRVDHPHYLPTAHLSMKLKQLPARDDVFDERLKISEARFTNTFDNEVAVYFSSIPRVYHKDREKWLDVLRHHYETGHHLYFIQFGNNFASRCFNPLYRLLFVLIFFPLLPLFALTGTFNTKPPAFHRWRFYLFIYLLWLAKGIAVLEAAIRPRACLLQGREAIDYEEAIFDSVPDSE